LEHNKKVQKFRMRFGKVRGGMGCDTHQLQVPEFQRVSFNPLSKETPGLR